MQSIIQPDEEDEDDDEGKWAGESVSECISWLWTAAQ